MLFYFKSCGFQHHQAAMRNRDTVNCKTAKVVKVSERRGKESSSMMRSGKNIASNILGLYNHLATTSPQPGDQSIITCMPVLHMNWRRKRPSESSWLWPDPISEPLPCPLLPCHLHYDCWWACLMLLTAQPGPSSTFTTTLQPAWHLARDGCSLIVELINEQMPVCVHVLIIWMPESWKFMLYQHLGKCWPVIKLSRGPVSGWARPPKKDASP